MIRSAVLDNTLKIAFVGSHGVGKTTLCYGLAARLKRSDISLDVVGEVARRCPLPINRGTTLDAQSWILHTQIAEEIVAASRYDVVICDRSVLDNYVYLLLSSGAQPKLEQLVDHWTSTYGLLVHVPIVNTPRPDGMRSVDPAFQRAVDERLEKEVALRDLDVLHLDDLDRDLWLDRVEQHVTGLGRPAQLELP
ncbi:MAG: ATP-binding protein [Thermoanaerobaculia bacterium]|nr:ATP-binding protein [Thermoanaerobaculia bacterium]